jgi:hypothetical protein
MRTTLSIDDDVLAAARRLATNGESIGNVVSRLVRKALTEQPLSESGGTSPFPTIPRRPDAVPVTLEMVNRLRDEEP